MRVDSRLIELIADTRDNVRAWIDCLPEAQRVKDLPNSSGLYFVVHRGTQEVVYVGQSVHMKRRWVNHKLRKKVDNATCSIRYYIDNSYTPGNKDFLETFFICTLWPYLNRTVQYHIDLMCLEVYIMGINARVKRLEATP